jgi:hypothetical protein
MLFCINWWRRQGYKETSQFATLFRTAIIILTSIQSLTQKEMEQYDIPIRFSINDSLLHVQDQFVRHGSVRLIQCESAE